MAEIKVLGHKLFYRDLNQSDTILVFLHGIPVDGSLWDGVIQELGPQFRSIVPDFLGFGKSEKPLDIDYSLENYTLMLDQLVEDLDLSRLFLVGMDLGLMVGLNYWTRHPEKICGLILMEGIVVDIDIALHSQSIANRLLMSLMKIELFARNAFVEQGEKSAGKMIKAGTIRKVESVNDYSKAFADKELCERVLLHGVCAHTLSNHQKTREPADSVKRYYKALCDSELPKLFFYAKPGSTMSGKLVRRLRSDFRNSRWVCAGPGKHFLPFDAPQTIAHAIQDFVEEYGRK